MTTYTLVLVRHGQSTWNLENRFTGWTDVDLTEQGVQEAHDGGRLLREEAHRAGFLENGEKAVFLRHMDAGVTGEIKKSATPDVTNIEPSHLRILWIVVSMLALLYYFARGTRKGEV